MGKALARRPEPPPATVAPAAPAETWRIPISPAQRWVLFNVSHSDGEKVQGQAGRVFRRWARAFGLDTIGEIVREHGGVASILARDDKPRLHTVTIENIEQALKVGEISHTPGQEMVMGELLDLVEDLKRTRAYEPAEGIPAFDAACEDWTPAKKDPVEAAAEKIAEFVRDKGAADLADAITRGDWDTEEDEAQRPADA